MICVEAVLDVEATSLTRNAALYLDATVRNPLVKHYQGEGHSSTQDGYACKMQLHTNIEDILQQMA